MSSIKLFSKFLTSDSPVKIVKGSYTRILAENASSDYGFSTNLVYVPRNFYSRKGLGCKKKKEKAVIQTHPCVNKLPKPSCTCPESPNTRAKECKPIESDPCEPPPDRYPSKMPQIQDCPETDLFTNTSQQCLREDKRLKEDIDKSSQKILLIGLLFTVLTVGTVSITKT